MPQVGNTIDQLVPKRAVRPFVEVALFGVAKVISECGAQLLRDVPIENGHRHLVVQLKRAVVEVRRADARPDSVDHDRLLMEQRPLVLVDLDAAAEQSPEVMMAGMLHDRIVGR